jgi:carboxylesterase type B
MFALSAPGLVMFHENSFARTGDPNGAGLPEWPRYDAANRSCLVFDERPRIVRDPDGDEVRRAYGLS